MKVILIIIFMQTASQFSLRPPKEAEETAFASTAHIADDVCLHGTLKALSPLAYPVEVEERSLGLSVLPVTPEGSTGDS